jgi:Holliday junction DNA helicase RuvA
MYDHLIGTVVEKTASRAVVRCAGVGYECRVSLSTATGLKVGEERQVFTLLHVVDGMPSLLGFATRAERELAKRVLGVSGVGPSIALALLSVYTPHQLATAIANDDAAALRKVKGVGQKTSERICLELRDVMPKLDLDVDATPHKGAGPGTQATDDAVAALVTLGFSEKDAKDKVEKARKAGVADDTEALVVAVLRG